MRTVTYRRAALRALRRMQPQTARRIRDRIAAVAEGPRDPGPDIVRLTNRPGFRLRVGSWRVIFDMDEESLDVLVIDSRGDVYKPRKG